MAQTPEILPVLIGADMNCYSVARAFHEEYGVVSHAFGRWPMGDTMYSRIVQCTYIQDIDNRDTLLATVTQFAHQHADKTCIVLGCTDDYASLLMDIRDELPENCVVPYITPALRDKLVSKADFYDQMCIRDSNTRVLIFTNSSQCFHFSLINQHFSLYSSTLFI